MQDLTIFRSGLTLALIGALAGCGGGGGTTTSPTQGPAALVLNYRVSTQPRTDLPASTQACVTAVGETHAHLTWRTPDYVAFRAAGANRWELSLTGAPVGQRLSVLIHDGNRCDVNATGAAQHDVFVNNVQLLQTVTVTTAAGAEPGLAFSVDASGNVTP